jgi:hypothetical protein
MAAVLPESREALPHDLEALTGRAFQANIAKQKRSTNGWRAVKTTTLLILLILSFVQYYLADVLLQTVSLREMTFFVPVKTEIRS